jgi:hypothetical protein
MTRPLARHAALVAAARAAILDHACDPRLWAALAGESATPAPLDALREAAEWALAFIADPEGLAAEKTRVQTRLRAAIDATPAPLDVERLARALEAWWADDGAGMPGTGSWVVAGGWKQDAAFIAAAYAEEGES